MTEPVTLTFSSYGDNITVTRVSRCSARTKAWR